MMTSIFGPAQEQACAILEQTSNPRLFVGIKMESCTGLAANFPLRSYLIRPSTRTQVEYKRTANNKK